MAHLTQLNRALNFRLPCTIKTQLLLRAAGQPRQLQIAQVELLHGLKHFRVTHGLFTDWLRLGANFSQLLHQARNGLPTRIVHFGIVRSHSDEGRAF